MIPTRILLLGEDNPLSAAPEHALYDDPPGCAGWRLRRIFGLSSDDYLALDRTNLCTPAWNLRLARERAALLTGVGAPWKVIVALGAKVRSALARALSQPRFEEWQVWIDERPVTAPAPTIVCLPHPSGRCQAWTLPGARDRARGLLRTVAPDVPWGQHEGE